MRSIRSRLWLPRPASGSAARHNLLLRIKGFRRARNFGFLHPNSKRSITLLHYLFGMPVKRMPADEKSRPRLRCRCCGGQMVIVQTCLPPRAGQFPVLATAEAPVI